MASAHYTRDYVGVVHVSLSSMTIPYAAYRSLGIGLIYLNASDGQATDAKRREVVQNGFKCGLFYPASTEYQFGGAVGQAVSAKLSVFAKTEAEVGGAGQTPVLLDFEPTYGSVTFWGDFLDVYRVLRPGRVTDFTPEPFKAADIRLDRLINLGRMDVRVQYYFGDMSPVDGGEARDDYVSRGIDPAAVRGFVDGGRKIKPPMFYDGRIVRALQHGTIIWNSNLLREGGLV